MSILLFIGALLFFIIPAYIKNRISFIDIYLLYCLYFDAVIVFAGGQSVNLSYLQYTLVLVFSIHYYIFKPKVLSSYDRKILFATFGYMLVSLLIPIFKGYDINETVRGFSVNFTSLIILPLSFNYYSQKGNINKLFRSGYYFLISWVIIVLLFTLFKIDVTGEQLGSETFGGSIFYFGNLAQRGAITYISFALLLVPLILQQLVKRNKMRLFLSSGFIVSILLIALKRYSLLTIILGTFNYFVKGSLSTKLKMRIVIGLSLIFFSLFLFTDIGTLVKQSYFNRGAELKFSRDALETDIRIYEPIYVINELGKGSINGYFFGSKEKTQHIGVQSDLHSLYRKIHNEYGQILLATGLVGLLFYLYLYIILYRITVKIKKELEKRSVNVNEYWIVFQNLILIFIIAGMVGGHVHITLRSLVLLYAGGISGYFYSLLWQKKTIVADKEK